MRQRTSTTPRRRANWLYTSATLIGTTSIFVILPAPGEPSSLESPICSPSTTHHIASRETITPGRPLSSVQFVSSAPTRAGTASSEELTQPPICSAATGDRAASPPICNVTRLGDSHNQIKVDLTAETSPITLAGYTVTTENYNGAYLAPVIEALPGDTVAAHLTNSLSAPPQHGGMSHGSSENNPTNLHYFHGGLVSPNNARPKAAELGNGDNIYVYLRSERQPSGAPNDFELEVPIPGDNALDARVLEGVGLMSHPLGLNWYHSHLHGISSEQVLGGMSGLLSVGEATANIKAACQQNPRDRSKCLNDVAADTTVLKARTKVRYAILRDLPLQNISALPESAISATANWDPTAVDFPPGSKCGVRKDDGLGMDNDNPKLRLGFCQRDPKSAWLFTINGQRFPTITVHNNENLLLRLGNLSANVQYWLELYNEADGTTKPLTLISVDGVVPARPSSPEEITTPLQALNVDNLLLMPASRSEIYIRNDAQLHPTTQTYILRTKGLQNIGADEWPEIQLAKIVLEPSSSASAVALSLNGPITTKPLSALALARRPASSPTLPPGCVRDLDAASLEYRRVTFLDGDLTPTGERTWQLQTEIVHPEGTDLRDEGDTSNKSDTESTIGPTPFESYVQGTSGLVDWSMRHVCITMNHSDSHKQLWVLSNLTDTLHNFHIHQIKFRLATRADLAGHQILPPTQSHTCVPLQQCASPDYQFYNDQQSNGVETAAEPIWHDTIPVPPFTKIFIIMSFDAKQQIGRFVFHCHILKHEDKGLMAPIEVWDPEMAAPL